MVVLVCYAGNEDGTIWEVIQTLDSAGHETWMDRWALQGADWQDHVYTVIQRAKLLLYVLDRETLADPRRAWIAQQAIAANVPVVVARSDPALGVPDALRGFVMVDFTGGATPRAIGELIETVQHESRSRVGAPSTTNGSRIRTLSGPHRAYWIVAITAISLMGTFLLDRVLMPLGLAAGGPEGPLFSQLMVAVYRINPLLFLLGMALLFTLVSSPAGSLLTLLIAQIMLGLGYLLAPAADSGLLLLMMGLALIGYFVGESRVLLWPWLSFRLDRACRQYQACVAAGDAVRGCAVPVIRLLDSPLVVPAAGAAAAMQMLADDGLTVAQFAACAHHPTVLEEYQHFVYQISLEKLEQVESFAEALTTIQSYQIVPPEAQTQIRIFLQKREHCTTVIELLRAYGQFLWYLEKAERTALEPSGRAQPAATLKAIQLLIRLTYHSIHYQDATQYWFQYRWLESQVERIQATGYPTTGASTSAPRTLIREAVTRLMDTVRVLQELEEDMLRRFPAREQQWHLEMLTIDLDPAQLLTTEYQERQEALRREIARLEQLHRSQPASWLTINQTATEVTEQYNPWCLLALQLIEQLQLIKRLDVEYVNWAEQQLSAKLGELRTLQDVAELEQHLAGLEISGDSFGPMVDGMVRWLMDISAEAQSAIDWPQGTYQYRQSLINAQQKLEDLRIWLQSRFNRARPRQWAEQVRGVALILEQHLNQQRLVDTSKYVDPYMVGNPIPPKRAALFKGRMELAERIVEWLRSDNRPTLVLHGARRMGKTSFLLQLQNLMSGWHDSPISIFVDGQNIAMTQSDTSFFYTLARAIHTQLRRRGLQISRPSRQDFATYPYETLTPWLEDEVFPAIGEETRLLVTIDEFEKIGAAIREGKLTVHVLDFLRHTVQHSENMLFLFCGVQTLDSLGPNAASYFIGVQTIEIGYLERRAAEELIRNPTLDDHGLPNYSASVVREIIDLTHGQPYLIQAICSRIIIRANERQLSTINTVTLRDVLPEVFTNGRMYFQNIWKDAGVEGRRVLLRLAEGPARLSAVEVGSPAVRALLERHVICRAEGGKPLDYQIEIPLVQHWIARQVIPADRASAPAPGAKKAEA